MVSLQSKYKLWMNTGLMWRQSACTVLLTRLKSGDYRMFQTYLAALITAGSKAGCPSLLCKSNLHRKTEALGHLAVKSLQNTI